jgi:hypothetical protein
MPRGSDWFNFVYVNMAYLALIFVISIFLRLQEIRKNWPKYRCNPVYMPFADDVSKNFAYCVQNMQANYMGYLLQPIWTTISSMQSMAMDTMGSLQNFRKMIAFIRDSFGGIMGSVMGIFVNLIFEFQKITIAVKDSIAKLSGTMVTFMYMMDGVRMTLGSVWSGPPGQMVRSLCFHPETSVTLQGGEKKAMKDVSLGNVLSNGSRVIGTMCIANENEEALYSVPRLSNVPSSSVLFQSSVLVTGAHYLLNRDTGKYVKVRDHPDASLTSDSPPVFACLITDDHRIRIGDRDFWDWDDDAIPDKLR